MNIEWNKVTWYSKFLAVILALLILVLGLYVGQQYQQIKEVEKSLSSPTSLGNHTSDSKTVLTESGGIADQFLNSKYKVLGVFRSNNTKTETLSNLVNQVDLVVVTDKNVSDENNDTICGSLYSQKTCYFFIEPLYVYGAPDKAKYLGSLVGEGAFQFDSVNFVDPNTVKFETADGDGGYAFTKTWELNLATGKFTLLDKKEFGE